MSIYVSIAFSVLFVPLILILAAREVSRYRGDQQMSSVELYPYSKKRLLIRSSVSAALLLTVFLLFWGPFFFSAKNATGFLIYVSLILLLAIVMVVLAILDWRESKALEQLSEKRLLKELIEDLKQGGKSPEIH